MRILIVLVLNIVACALLASAYAATPAAAQQPQAASAIVIQDQVSLRAAPRDSAQQQALLWQGEVVEIRGERMDYVQVYDYRRERGGYVRANQVKRLGNSPADAAELKSVIRFLRDTPGAEALGIGFVAVYLQSAPGLSGEEGAEAFDALGNFADRLARRASSAAPQSKSVEATLSAHLEVAARYGLKFSSIERDGRISICYDGDALRRVLALPATPEQAARAALALTRPACVSPDLRPQDALALDEWRADVLDRVEIVKLPAYLRNRVQMRRASVWSGLAYGYARRDAAAGEATGKIAINAAQRAIVELVGVNKNELPDNDAALYADAAMHVSASRWAAAVPVKIAEKPGMPGIVTRAGTAGETCVFLVDAKHDVKSPLARRCTYGVVWTASASGNSEGNAVALAVQTMSRWRELWVFKKRGDGWDIDVLPPAAVSPDTGYIEFAGWVPGGKQMLVAREARGDGKYKRNFEVLRLDTLTPERQSGDPTQLGSFQRWQDPSWKRHTLSLR